MPAPDENLADAIGDVFFREADYAAHISHRPDTVKHIFLDANSRCWMARKVLEMPEMQAMKTALWDLSGPRFGGVPEHRSTLESLGLPGHVIDWVVAPSAQPCTNGDLS